MLDRPSLPIDEIIADRRELGARAGVVGWRRGRAPLGYIKGMAVMFAVA